IPTTSALQYAHRKLLIHPRITCERLQKFNIALDYSERSADALNTLITDVELLVRCANDMEDGAYVGDDVANFLDLSALGAYYGELFVRHAGATWTEAEGEDGPEPAVTRNGETVLPLTLVRYRVYDRAVHLGERFRAVREAMTAVTGGG
ncbi:MAG: hypothetical protein K2V38_06770, partial [Gemmataceae bacterium]|nr:hypothetical protein [Gemmataceae bacterium]